MNKIQRIKDAHKLVEELEEVMEAIDYLTDKDTGELLPIVQVQYTRANESGSFDQAIPYGHNKAISGVIVQYLVKQRDELVLKIDATI